MEKTAKITAVQENQRSYQGKFGKTYIHMVKFEGDPDDRNWEYHCLKEQCEKFKAGQESSFETKVETSQDGKYTNYKIKPKVEPTNGNGASKFKKEDKDQGLILFMSLYSSTCNFYAQRGNAAIEDVIRETEKAFDAAMKHSTLKA